MTSSPKQLKLRVSFDVDQISGKLNWDFLPRSRPDFGPHAGAILLPPGEHLHLEVIGNGKCASGYLSFEIVDCCLFTRPQVVCTGPAYARTQFAPPSPFVGLPGASYALPLKFTTQEGPHEQIDNYRSVVKHWEHRLTVGNTLGRWETSFIMTVHITRIGQDTPEARVFFFDPESEVGDGGHPSE